MTEGDPYLEKAAELAARLRARPVEEGDVEGALAAARDVAVVDVDAPTGGSPNAAMLVKSSIKRLTSWYFAYLAEQVNDLAFALVRASTSLAARSRADRLTLEDLSRRLAALEHSLGAMENRLGAMENRLGAMENRLGAMEGNLGRLERRFGELAGQPTAGRAMPATAPPGTTAQLGTTAQPGTTAQLGTKEPRHD